MPKRLDLELANYGCLPNKAITKKMYEKKKNKSQKMISLKIHIQSTKSANLSIRQDNISYYFTSCVLYVSPVQMVKQWSR